ncbi:uncharacterized protein LOC111632991 [Centruroides sculpturatus]|uniref:uncharacterized protein LOC111632991 n=1 Tax=Centruroides sculpturatus TaxID=218467 RepID=UPI000C6D555C|nr:uncharacterized protein LOC111632991 [Centruroides sculpturatus]
MKTSFVIIFAAVACVMSAEIKAPHTEQAKEENLSSKIDGVKHFKQRKPASSMKEEKVMVDNQEKSKKEQDESNSERTFFPSYPYDYYNYNYITETGYIQFPFTITRNINCYDIWGFDFCQCYYQCYYNYNCYYDICYDSCYDACDYYLCDYGDFYCYSF